jgi:hypothetical protein
MNTETKISTLFSEVSGNFAHYTGTNCASKQMQRVSKAEGLLSFVRFAPQVKRFRTCSELVWFNTLRALCTKKQHPLNSNVD